MFCPVCESEYEPGITACPDDNSPLVERLTPENTVHDNSEARFVALHNLGSPAEAEMVNDILSKTGFARWLSRVALILCHLCCRRLPKALTIFVDERDVDRAMEVYNAFFGGDTTPLTGGPVEEEDEE